MTRAARIFSQLTTTRRPPVTRHLLRRAVVLGGSVAGLLAARVLADHADEVLVVERDPLPDGPAPRPGVPQSQQVHTLLPAGRTQLDRWFDGFSAELLDGGAMRATTANGRFLLDGHPKVSVPGAEMVMSTRPFLESVLRRRVLALPNVRVVHARATGLLVDGDTVRGVQAATDPGAAAPAGSDPQAGSADDGGVLEADLVVDAMGRSSRLSRWLTNAGRPAPPLRRMGIDLNYTTALFHRDDPDPEVALAFANFGIGRTPPGLAPAIVQAVEGDRWIVMMGGYRDHKPGRTLPDMRRICARLGPEFAQATAGDPLEPIAGYTQADSRRRDFAALSSFPARLLAVGDAVASFNPIYGQGMSSAALHASCLSRFLCSAPDLDAPARPFFELQQVVVDAAWQTSATPDLALPHVEAPRPLGYPLTRALSTLLVDATVTDLVLARRFNAVVTMQAHPSTLITPVTVGRTLAVTARRLLRRGTPAAS